ncbi:hypothetical protein [Sinisalibacter aestuarii]|uniref:Lipoprotein n=1 Tax=Sinisalibacter aestuarii TaxID=2949426 RepID=A0ABQ5LWL1_9RHOB|nr:hypothetical protein [Sinisalibacter aestuarii]GKY88761.1 hypothetical protein STA1M1_26300 [Sinisalibacter aestuarii]
MRRIFVLLTLLLGLAACGSAESVWAPDEAVERARFSTSGPPTLTLFTVINERSGNGGHAALMVSAPSERVLFDPAGSFHHPRLPERNDVVFGMTDPAVDFYIDYHSRTTWRVVRQDLVVPAAVAEQALRAVQEYGAVPKAFCANSISTVLRGLPGFEGFKVSMFPENVQAEFAQYQGVVRREYHDMDPDNNGEILARGI